MAVVEYYPPDKTPLRGTALVVHGLNLKPREMRFVIQHLNGAGIEVIALALRGHGENFANIAQWRGWMARLRTSVELTHQEWLDEVHAAYHIARLRSDMAQTPLFLVGFSLGGLLLCDLLLRHENTRADRMLLLAPALRVRWTSKIVQLLFPLPKLGIPSLAPRRYQANPVTSVVVYRSLFAIMEQLEAYFRDPQTAAASRKRLNLPTLILMRRWDELVSYHAIARLIQENGLVQWRLVAVDKGRDSKVLSNHPVFDPIALGDAPWNAMMELALSHLTGG